MIKPDSNGCLSISTDGHSIQIGPNFEVEFQRTLRIPDDGNEYPLPPGLGSFPIFRVEDYKDTVPKRWLEKGGFFIPMYQREALWMSFETPYHRACAVKIGIGELDAISGKRLHGRLNKSRQNYVVTPDQPWLDGINSGKGFIRQFVAMPLGMGYTVEGQLTGKEKHGGIQIQVFEPKPGLFPENNRHELRHMKSEMMMECCEASSMGLGAGGKMKQDIYPDPHGVETWDTENFGKAYIHIVNSMDFREITGLEPPATPISARDYSSYGLPWFDLYDEGKGDLKPADPFKKVKTIKEVDEKNGFESQQDDSEIEINTAQVVLLKK